MMTKSPVYRDLQHLPYMAYIDVLNNVVIYTDSLYVYAFMSLVYPYSLFGLTSFSHQKNQAQKRAAPE